MADISLIVLSVFQRSVRREVFLGRESIGLGKHLQGSWFPKTVQRYDQDSLNCTLISMLF